MAALLLACGRDESFGFGQRSSVAGAPPAGVQDESTAGPTTPPALDDAGIPRRGLDAARGDPRPTAGSAASDGGALADAAGACEAGGAPCSAACPSTERFDVYPDLDGDGYGAAAEGERRCELAPGWVARAGDCDDADPDVFVSCGLCTDEDADAFFSGCDQWVVRSGPDCDDRDPDNHVACSSCVDRDGDSVFVGCDRFDVRSGPDCSDSDPDNSASCEACVDRDGDGWFVGCDVFSSRAGPDCDDGDADNWLACEHCRDGDGDQWFDGCDRYALRSGPDCNDVDQDNTSGCQTCIDRDGDLVFVGCDRFVQRSGPDCNDTDPDNQQQCPTCTDRDRDGYYQSCDGFQGALGPDCNDDDTDNYAACQTCVDSDGDAAFAGCDRYLVRAGPDCSDADFDNDVRCEVCRDQDADGYFAECDRFTLRNGPDCDDGDVQHQATCGEPPPSGDDCASDNVTSRCSRGNVMRSEALAIDPFTQRVSGQLLAGHEDWYRLELPGTCSLRLDARAFDLAPVAALSLRLHHDDAVSNSTSGAATSLTHRAGAADEALYLQVMELAGSFVEYELTLQVDCTPENLRVAFFGDQSLGGSAQAVLALVRREQPDLLVHLGDFDYLNDPVAWEQQTRDHLGEDVPMLAIIGNHDVPAWSTSAAGGSGYRSVVEARHARVPGLYCEGELGVAASCRFQGLLLVESAIGTLPEIPDHDAHVEHLRSALRESLTSWKLCLWHKNQRDMQLGVKTDEVGWRAYDACLAEGAAIVTAHEHSYARSFTLTDFGAGAREVNFGASGVPSLLDLGPNRTFVVVSGLGGHSIRPFEKAIHGEALPAWWATGYTSNLYVRDRVPVAEFAPLSGALFVDFHVDGDPRLARGVFKAIDGSVIDEFLVRLQPE